VPPEEEEEPLDEDEELDDELLEEELDELDDDELLEDEEELDEEPPPAGVKTATDCTSRAVADFHDIVTVPAAVAPCVELAEAEEDCTEKRCTMPASFVRMLPLVDPTPNVSTTHAPALTGVDVVMVFADVLLLAIPAGTDCRTPLNEIALPMILLLSDCDVLKVICTVYIPAAGSDDSSI
jgi:hypothetical protein